MFDRCYSRIFKADSHSILSETLHSLLSAHAVLNIIQASVSLVIPKESERSGTSLVSCWVAERLTLVAKSFSSSRQLSEISSVKDMRDEKEQEQETDVRRSKRAKNN